MLIFADELTWQQVAMAWGPHLVAIVTILGGVAMAWIQLRRQLAENTKQTVANRVEIRDTKAKVLEAASQASEDAGKAASAAQQVKTDTHRDLVKTTDAIEQIHRLVNSTHQEAISELKAAKGELVDAKVQIANFVANGNGGGPIV